MSNKTPRVNDGYLGKVAFWLQQYQQTQSDPATAKYNEGRCYSSLLFFVEKAQDAQRDRMQAANTELCQYRRRHSSEWRELRNTYLLAVGRLEDLHRLEDLINTRTPLEHFSPADWWNA